MRYYSINRERERETEEREEDDQNIIDMCTILSSHQDNTTTCVYVWCSRVCRCASMEREREESAGMMDPIRRGFNNKHGVCGVRCSSASGRRESGRDGH